MAAPTFPVDYQHLFHALPDNFLLIAPNAEATIVDNTDQHVAVSLKERAAVVGKPFFEAFPTTDKNEAAIIAESHEHVRRHLEPHTMPLIRYDLEMPAEQGGGFVERYWEATHYPILDAQGQLQFILQRTQDVTERHLTELRNQQMQRELAESQERARFTLEALPIMVWTTTPTGEVDYFNQRWLQFTGKTLEQLLGTGWMADVHPDDQAGAFAIGQRALETGEELQLEYRLRRHDGQYRWLLARAMPRKADDGRIIMWAGGAIDIHEQRQMVQELLAVNEQQADLSEQAYQAARLVQSQQEMFERLFVQAPALICILRGPKHRYDFVNPLYQQLFPNRQLVGKTVGEALPEVAEQGITELLNQVYDTGEPFLGNEIAVMLDQNGTSRLHYFNFTYQLFYEGDQKAGITVFAYDVTSLVQARKALEKSAD